MNTKKLKGGQLNLPCGNITKRNENRTHPRPSPWSQSWLLSTFSQLIHNK